ncbi:MAG: GH92 family glycosyl hydrolase [Lacibacter sp.]
MNRLLLLCFTFFSLTAHTQPVNYARLVNPFIGTDGHGHTFPGPSRPFGMMQLSPDTRLEGWDGCSGYHYSDTLLYGFSHTHLSGTGVADYCDVLLLPFTGSVQWKNTEYRTPFSHGTEQAHAGYYAVQLDKHAIKAELTTADRSGMHRYRFQPGTTEGRLLIDLVHRDEVLDAALEVVNAYEVRGWRRSRSWAADQQLFFYIRFEQPVIRYELAANDVAQHNAAALQGKHIKAWLGFQLPAAATLQLKIGISAVSMENAQQNLDAEITGWDFDGLVQASEAAWNKELGKIEVKGGTPEERITFYTALYHASLAPNLYTDVNGAYRGTDGRVHNARGFTNYTVFSLWDTYRALHPLMTILNRERTRDWIQTFLHQYQHGGMLPVWELSANETFCMIGYHSVPVIYDAWSKGIRGFDSLLALAAMRSYAEGERFGLAHYRRKGFLSNREEAESVSKTVEYSYDDWCIARFAEALGQTDVAATYYKRAAGYRHLFDPSTGFLRGKVEGFWHHPFVPGEVNNFYTEGNAWQYLFAAQHDVAGMQQLLGGQKAFAAKLQDFFTTSEPLSGRDQADVTGLIGQYAHGNEPSHHAAYLFNHVGQPGRTQELVHRIRSEFYSSKPDGLIGNEDCGQMSAWYVFSALGFYPVTPGSGRYEIGTPLFNEAVLHLENGKQFTIKAKRAAPGAFYVGKVTLNGGPHNASYLLHTAIADGGVLEMELFNQPQSWGSGANALPLQESPVVGFTAVPFFDMSDYTFEKQLEVKLGHISNTAAIYYRLSGTSEAFRRYTRPFTLKRSGTLQLYAVDAGIASPVVEQRLHRLPGGRSITVLSEVHPMYTAGGPQALVDGITGTTNWKTGEWQSYFNRDFEAVLTLNKLRTVRYVGVHVLQDISPWILFPQAVTFEGSADGVHYRTLATVTNTVARDEKTPMVQELGAPVNARVRFIRIRARNGGALPAGHESAGAPSHLFIDEVIIR